MITEIQLHITSVKMVSHFEIYHNFPSIKQIQPNLILSSFYKKNVRPLTRMPNAKCHCDVYFQIHFICHNYVAFIDQLDTEKNIG